MAYFDFKDAEPAGILNELIPNNTPSWNLWKNCICAAIKHKFSEPSKLIDDPTKYIRPSIEGMFNEEFNKLAKKEDRTFVKKFLEQADKEFNSVNEVSQKIDEKRQTESTNNKEVPTRRGILCA